MVVNLKRGMEMHPKLLRELTEQFVRETLWR